MSLHQFLRQLPIRRTGFEGHLEGQQRRLRQMSLQSGICQQVVGLHIGGILIERLLGDEDRLQWV